MFLWSLPKTNGSVQHQILKGILWKLVLQTWCHKIDTKCTLTVDVWKFGQLNGSKKICVLHLNENQLLKCWLVLKAGMTLVPHFPSEEMVWAIKSVLSTLPTCTSFLMISCLKSVLFQNTREWTRWNDHCRVWTYWQLINRVLHFHGFFIFSCNFHALLYYFLLFFFPSLRISSLNV